MAITFISSTNEGAQSTTATLAKPPGTSVNNILVATIAARGNNVTVTPDQAGWTMIRLDTETTHQQAESWWRLTTGSDPASWTWTLGSNTRHAGVMLAYSGVSTTTPIDVHAGQTTDVASLTIDGPSVTTTFKNDMLLAVAVSEASGVTITAPTGYTLRGTASAGGSANAGNTISVFDKSFVGPGPTGTWSAPQNTSRDTMAQSIALKDSAAGRRLLTALGVGI